MRSCRTLRTFFVVAALTACQTTTGTNPVAGVTLSVATLNLIVGDTARVTATPKDAAGATVAGAAVTWTSDNSAVATVINGLITAAGAGSTIVRAAVGSVSGTVTVAVSAGVSGSEFVVSNNTLEEDFGNVAFNGTNYLATIQIRNASGVGNTIGGQLIAPTGSLVGSFIGMPSASGDPPHVASDGSNFLLVWADHSQGSSGNGSILGQFVSGSGALVGSPFSIAATGSTFQAVQDIVFGGGTYFISYVRASGGTSAAPYKTYGRTISTTGTVGPELAMSSSFTTEGFSGVEFDGANFFTVYTDGTTIKGRFVSASGTLGSEVTVVTASGFQIGDLAFVAYNGTNFLVVFRRLATGASAGDTYAQRLTASGATVGGLIPVATESIEEFPVGVVASASNFLVSYLDLPGAASTLRIRARFVTGAGGATGSPLTIAQPVNGKTPLGGVWRFAGNKYFAYYLRGVPSGNDPLNTNAWTGKDLYAALLTIPSP